MAGLYIHIPLCACRCAYCDFYSTTLVGKKSLLVDALCHEMELRRNYLSGQPIHTIYIGGGTPSQLPASLLAKLFDTAASIFDCSQLYEVTLEANPEDLTPAYIRSLKGLPVNRISMGVQSFSDADLRLINRRHTASRALQAVADCHAAGFQHLSIDLIYGLPFQTVEGWQHNLDVAVGLPVDHISAYMLTYEEGTPLYKMWQQGKVQPADDDLSLHFFTQLRQTLLSSGYRHYEISNFAKPGGEAQHNSSYWHSVPYIGIGPSAHSFDGKNRQWNVRNLEEYLSSMGKGKMNCTIEHLSTEEAYNDFVITSLRTAEGMDLNLLQTKFPAYFNFCIRSAASAIKAGNLVRTDHALQLTPKGIFVSDAVFVDLVKA